jgi:hypothetical protein
MVQVAGIARVRSPRRKAVLLRLDPRVYNALARWAAEEFRSTNAQIEFVLHQALVEVGRIRTARAGSGGDGQRR